MPELYSVFSFHKFYSLSTSSFLDLFLFSIYLSIYELDKSVSISRFFFRNSRADFQDKHTFITCRISAIQSSYVQLNVLVKSINQLIHSFSLCMHESIFFLLINILLQMI